MIEVVIALCYALGAWFYSILRYYDLWKRGKVPVVFFAFLHVFSLIVVFLFETGISAMISDVVSVIMHAYSVIYGSVMILTPILCFVRGIVRFIGKKAGCSGKIYRFFNHPTKLILGFFVVTMCVGAVIFWKSRCISWEETVISQENKKEPVKDTSIVYISNCFVGSDMTAHVFDSLVEKVNEKKPDVILFGGNLFGRHTKEVTIDKTLASIKKMKAALGIYMVEGSADSVLVEEKKEKIFQCDYLKVDWEKHQVSIDGKEVHLTPMEYKILKLLIDNRGKVLTHNYILGQIWGSAQGVEAANLRVFMAALRRKIEKDPGNCRFILTEIGVGYRFREATE